VEKPIDMEKLKCAIRKGKPNNTPGQDGISLEPLKRITGITMRDVITIMNNMQKDGVRAAKQKHGIIVCIRETTHPKQIVKYRPLTVLDTDYKLLARIIANRLRPGCHTSYNRASPVV
jgi:hypothetical protein